MLSTLVMAVLLFGFQNCQQPPYQDELNGNEPVVKGPGRSIKTPGSSDQDDSDLSSTQLFQIDSISNFKISFFADLPVPMERNGNQFSLVDRVEFIFDSSSGHVIGKGSQSGFVGKYCLNAEQLDSFAQLLNGRNVCQIERSIPEGTLCTMALVPGYAKVFSLQGEQQINSELGASNNGCRASTIDFCENHGQIVKGWFEDFKNNRDSLVCDF